MITSGKFLSIIKKNCILSMSALSEVLKETSTVNADSVYALIINKDNNPSDIFPLYVNKNFVYCISGDIEFDSDQSIEFISHYIGM